MQDFSIVTFSVKANGYKRIKMLKTIHINSVAEAFQRNKQENNISNHVRNYSVVGKHLTHLTSSRDSNAETYFMLNTKLFYSTPH